MEQFKIPDSLKEKLEQAETLEEVAKLCNEAGYKVTVDDLKAAEAADSGELSADDLDNVAGGVMLTTVTVAMVAMGAYAIWSYAKKRRR